MTMWMVRAEGDSRLFQPFIDQGVVAIGWKDVGPLDAFDSREDILAEVRKQWPEDRSGTHATYAGMIHRFVMEMEQGDGVITYDRMRRIYAIGKVSGDYRFDIKFEEEYPNIRPVEWYERKISRDDLSATTKNTLGSIMTLFQLSVDAENDVLRAMKGESAPPSVEVIEDKEEFLLSDLESRSVEFIKDHVVRLDWKDMQRLVAGMLRAMGYKTRVSESGPDRGKDIVASPDGLGFENPRIVVEVKHRPSSTIGSHEIRSFVGGRHPDDKGLYVSTGGFSKEAHYEAERSNVPVTLMGLDDLVKSIIDCYENMDTETRQLVPLRRIYWPIR